ncbi:hypothetical protein LTR56_021580 [Elasticomyces elasticus]|nr:hypothetical protein LTR56_021580 [Elasticomyces elasticus]KAK3626030.1 hypothetical protein LTR22_023338 [Elasticomyces elasticus]KAK4926740.1 hypothetical protein LTR49_006422 [Elasticomyces elasticus]KAK5762309.1 hypothetical protein LTS12_007468 [Elasticomyces elasticus]
MTSMPTRTHTTGNGAKALQKCHLLELPPELRLLIYEFVYAGDFRHEIVLDSIMVVSVNLSSDDVGRFAHFAALLRTCTLIRHEAEPVLYEAAPLDIYIEGEAYLYEKCWKGELHTCPFIKHITNIKKLEICVSDVNNSEDNAVRCIDGLINALPDKKRYGLDSIELWRGDDTWVNKTRVITALMGLNCKPGVRFLLFEGEDEVKLADCVSEPVYRKLVQKLGIKGDEETE